MPTSPDPIKAGVPDAILGQVSDKSSEGLVLARASDEDGAVIYLQWCNNAFCRITGYDRDEVLGARGTILIGPNTEQGQHLLLIEKLMNWERFTVTLQSTRKCGEPYRQQMSWHPMTDPDTGGRWWMCSIVELQTTIADRVKREIGRLTTPHERILEERTKTIRQLEKENQRLFELANAVARESNEDALTGLSNRRHFEVELKTWIKGLGRGGPDFAVLYIDLDRFKSVNDTLGHDAGDRLLVSVAAMLRRLTDDTDLIARFGGDEFVVLKPLGDSALSISSLADKIVAELQNPSELDGHSVHCTASVGVAIANAGMETPEQVVSDADMALYHAKAQGRARWSFFTEEMHIEAVATKRLAADLLRACDNQEFVPYFQPVIEAATGQIASAEVLVRWIHPTMGLLPPVAFLETAAKMGILKQIDEIMFAGLRKALRAPGIDMAALPRFAINVSAGRLADPNFIHDICSSGIPPKKLIVEILESVYLERMSDVVRWTLTELDGMGVTIAIDDFGTGHASIQGLLKVRPAIVKIDRQFIQPIVHDPTSRALVGSIVGIGKSLGLSIVAEGVETEDHARFVTDMGCTYLQGFHFGKPMPAGDFFGLLDDTGGRLWDVTALPTRLARARL